MCRERERDSVSPGKVDARHALQRQLDAVKRPQRLLLRLVPLAHGGHQHRSEREERQAIRRGARDKAKVVVACHAAERAGRLREGETGREGER